MYAIIQHRTFVWRDKMFIKDRGNIKWTSLMLVEHKKALKKLRENIDLKEKPELDEQELMRLNMILKKALKVDKTTLIVYYSKGKFKQIEGLIKKFLPLQRQILVKNEEQKIYLNLEDIFKLELKG